MGAFRGFAGSSGLCGFDLNTNKIINTEREKNTVTTEQATTP